jgi:Zn finger protein HypA/HybF involved in hydrogenase expression
MDAMHEYSLVRSLLDRVASRLSTPGRWGPSALDAGGELSGVSVELLRAAYDVCRVGRCAPGPRSRLRPCRRGGRARAAREDLPDDGPRRCARCGRPARLASGDDLLLERIELEVDDV